MKQTPSGRLLPVSQLLVAIALSGCATTGRDVARVQPAVGTGVKTAGTRPTVQIEPVAGVANASPSPSGFLAPAQPITATPMNQWNPNTATQLAQVNHTMPAVGSAPMVVAGPPAPPVGSIVFSTPTTGSMFIPAQRSQPFPPQTGNMVPVPATAGGVPNVANASNPTYIRQAGGFLSEADFSQKRLHPKPSPGLPYGQQKNTVSESPAPKRVDPKEITPPGPIDFENNDAGDKLPKMQSPPKAGDRTGAAEPKSQTPLLPASLPKGPADKSNLLDQTKKTGDGVDVRDVDLPPSVRSLIGKQGVIDDPKFKAPSADRTKQSSAPEVPKAPKLNNSSEVEKPKGDAKTPLPESSPLPPKPIILPKSN